MRYELFIVENNGKRFGYTENILNAAGYTADKTANVFHKPDTPDLTGTWCFLNTKDQWLDGDNSRVETLITDQKAPFIRHAERWDAAVVQFGIAGWDLDSIDPTWKPTEEGLSNMPFKIAQLVKGLVVSDLYGDASDPLFQKPSLTP